MVNRPEGVYERLAQIYTEEMGRRWQAEEQALREQNIRPLTPRADDRIRRAASKSKPGRAALPILAAAAAIVLLLTGLWRLPWWAGTLNDAGSGGFESQDRAPGHEDSLDESSPLDPDSGILLPLSFSLPGDLWVLESKLDNGMSIYVFGSDTYGRSVLSMEPLSGHTDPSFSGMKPMEIDGDQVFAKIDRDSRVIAFVHVDILYTVSSPYSTDVLILLYRAIVRGY